MRRTLAAVTACLAAILLLPGCWVWVDRNPGDVSRSFGKAREKVARLHSVPPERRGRPHRVKLLVYDGGDDTLTRLSVPLWLVRKIASHADEEAREARLSGDESDEDLEDLARFGLTLEKVLGSAPGLLVDVGSDDEQVLIWLE